ncbi:hypothetical protein DSO57_1033242 [Entomophthora muscae]|uniref:Uncharacterized protein n=1 Tax=Entomophthora muscae TaxID=34485 RepID=A0ACC2RR62_9FUNG|nr:hypothetical protein DSO57_1033242 [Entomophthora muscae]
MCATSNISNYSTNPQQFTPQLPAVLATATSDLLAYLAPNGSTPINGVQSQLTATSYNLQPNGSHLSLFPRTIKVPDVLFEDKVASFNKPPDFRCKAQVIGLARVHPCITFMNPMPDLPVSVDPAYVKEMMTLNLACRETIMKLLAKNPFYELDDLVINMLEEIHDLNKRFPGCKAALAQL